MARQAWLCHASPDRPARVERADRVLNLETIAKDVKIQVELNPARVAAWRLVGYENRVLAARDFADDTRDAGEIGAGHTVTALYEITPVGTKGDAPSVDALKYSQTPATRSNSEELLTVKLRYKAPDAPLEQGTSKLLEFPIEDDGRPYAGASREFKFASAVAAFGMILRDSQYKGNATFDAVIELAQEGRGEDPEGYREEFIEMVRKAKTLQRP
jgi:Ca-activated chloride channel family protein